MTIDEAIAMCHHDDDEDKEKWKEAAFVATKEVMRLRRFINELKIKIDDLKFKY